MSGIRALDSLSGKISGESVLKGTLSGIESLNGSICVTREYDTYSRYLIQGLYRTHGRWYNSYRNVVQQLSSRTVLLRYPSGFGWKPD